MPLSDIVAAYKRSLATQFGPGEVAALKRMGVARSFPVNVALPPPIVSSDLAGSVQQGRRVAIVLASDVVSSGFPLPFAESQDTIVAALRTEVISKVGERRVQGVIVAYELDLEGA